MSSIVKIPFFKTTIASAHAQDIAALTSHPERFGSRSYSKELTEALEKLYPGYKVFLTKSGTQALELAAMALSIEPGDEVIMPSFAFVGCANAFAARGAQCVFVDIRPEDMNIDSDKIEAAITPKTKAILTINYAGVSCDYSRIKEIAQKHRLAVVEDNAHAIAAQVDGQRLGTFGDYSVLSCDYMKQLSCGEGGALLVKGEPSDAFMRTYQMGTNKHDLLSGRSLFYEWKSLGSNYFLSEILSAWLLQEMEHLNDIIHSFENGWRYYHRQLKPLEDSGKLVLPVIPENHIHSEYIFYIRLKDAQERTEFIRFLADKGIETAFHYTALHSSDFGKFSGRMSGSDTHTVSESSRLLRLPLYYSLTEKEQKYVMEMVYQFFKE